MTESRDPQAETTADPEVKPEVIEDLDAPVEDPKVILGTGGHIAR